MQRYRYEVLICKDSVNNEAKKYLQKRFNVDKKTQTKVILCVYKLYYINVF